ncbi:MAG: uncharacterized protein JWM85_429 [Acidimicrobiaceae bacterium]|nr:uncharacterized protein [Acidimicrobiaceae bacterium]
MSRRLGALLSSRLGWTLLAAVAVVALAFGSYHPAAPSRAARIGALESEIKCPSCADLSVAQSNSAAALDLRAEITQMVRSGSTDAAVEARVVSQYGSSSLLAPPKSGEDALIWVVPLVVVVAVAVGLGAFLWRRRALPSAGRSGESERDEELVAAARGAPR